MLAYAEAKTSNLMAGLKSGDYAAFSRDFDEAMRKALPADKFAAFRDDIRAKIGDFQSRKVDSVRQTGDFVAVVYAARFTANDNVTLRVVFRVAEPHPIGGLVLQVAGRPSSAERSLQPAGWRERFSFSLPADGQRRSHGHRTGYCAPATLRPCDSEPADGLTVAARAMGAAPLCLLPEGQAPLLEADEELLAAQDQVVQHLHAQGAAGLHQLLGHLHVLGRGRGVAGGVGVRHHHGHGVEGDGLAEDLGGAHLQAVDAALVDALGRPARRCAR